LTDEKVWGFKLLKNTVAAGVEGSWEGDVLCCFAALNFAGDDSVYIVFSILLERFSEPWIIIM
jgi:hypothetical protein